MRAAVLEAYGEPLSIESVAEPELSPHGVIVDVDACGICRSDWHAWQGHGEWADDQVPLGQILGHEPAGRVARVGARVNTLEVGERVAVPFNLGEGSCYQCRNGHGNVCEDGYALGFESSVPGAFAEQIHVPHADFNVVTLPGGVSAEAVAALGCRYVTAFHALAHRADIDAGDWVAVHGCGGLGLAGVQIASALGARVIAVDVREEPLSMASDLGAEETIDASALEDGATDGPASVPVAIEGITQQGAHVSVDALGRAETCRNSLECLRIRGTHVQVGLTTAAEQGEVTLPIDDVTRWDVTIVGSRGMPPSRYDELVRMIDAGVLEPERLVTRRVDLEEVSERLAAMTDYETRGVEVVTSF
ncbi:zinc-dependent alcohol dehydrogenase family protein [Natronorubrum daqingense]|uniref:Alcohol dehydrogenase n=1 Tax=Natronorubrum daqingense TaxID=588898 RepID=A0A1N7C7Q2_9EURY|nr:zinc-dependent alcohol dehydrogenase family protein [Natronorubrum daqingense]APX96773.1 alcohol dehydrogenase [Natronorubrum daqingense]SIR59454.1 alcohol dehydrogenase [Natronorubrum daqingense]